VWLVALPTSICCRPFLSSPSSLASISLKSICILVLATSSASGGSQTRTGLDPSLFGSQESFQLYGTSQYSLRSGNNRVERRKFQTKIAHGQRLVGEDDEGDS
jgi:hypothetical protein